jgi:hypothetical protein
VAGATSMAAGEYVSVSSQTDAERADFGRETPELAETPEAELEELTKIYVARGLDRDLSEKVAVELTEDDALGAHARDALEISAIVTARPIQAALVSAATFALGAAAPRILALVAPAGWIGGVDRRDGGWIDDCGAGGSGRAQRLGGRGGAGARRCAGDVLGRARHAGDGGGGDAVWRDHRLSATAG